MTAHPRLSSLEVGGTDVLDHSTCLAQFELLFVFDSTLEALHTHTVD